MLLPRPPPVLKEIDEERVLGKADESRSYTSTVTPLDIVELQQWYARVSAHDRAERSSILLNEIDPLFTEVVSLLGELPLATRRRLIGDIDTYDNDLPSAWDLLDKLRDKLKSYTTTEPVVSHEQYTTTTSTPPDVQQLKRWYSDATRDERSGDTATTEIMDPLFDTIVNRLVDLQPEARRQMIGDIDEYPSELALVWVKLEYLASLLSPVDGGDDEEDVDIGMDVENSNGTAATTIYRELQDEVGSAKDDEVIHIRNTVWTELERLRDEDDSTVVVLDMRRLLRQLRDYKKRRRQWSIELTPKQLIHQRNEMKKKAIAAYETKRRLHTEKAYRTQMLSGRVRPRVTGSHRSGLGSFW